MRSKLLPVLFLQLLGVRIWDPGNGLEMFTAAFQLIKEFDEGLWPLPRCHEKALLVAIVGRTCGTPSTRGNYRNTATRGDAVNQENYILWVPPIPFHLDFSNAGIYSGTERIPL